MISRAFAPVRRLGIAMAAALSLAVPVAFAQGEPAVTKKATELRETPDAAGRTLVALPAQAAVMRMGDRKGPYIQVRTDAGQTGWVHLFDVGPASGAANTTGSGNSGGNVLRNVGALFSRPTTTATSASGVRGLTKEDLANAQPRPEQVQQMEAQRQDEQQARAFAGAASLTAVNVDPLPAPARPGTGGRSADPSNPDAQ